jgi:transposase-like protein
MGRPNPLADPDFAQSVAEAFVAGQTRRQMCDLFGVSDPDTITRWRRDARVKAIAFKLIEDRVLQVTRRVDAVIAERLENASEMTTKELLEVRKEYLGGKLREQHEKADDETVHEAQDWLSSNPEEAAELERILAGEKPSPVTAAQRA